MVGKLARWLRVLGVDVIYDTSLDDHQLVALARSENRILLTRDRPLASGTNEPQCLLVESENFREQLRQVVETYGIEPNQSLFTRCMDCNTILEVASRADIRDKVPPYVYSTQNHFKRCAYCDKILWGGTHRLHMQETLDEIFPERPAG